MKYTIQNGKFYRSTELSQEEVLELLNKSSIPAPKKLQLEDYDLGKPTSPNVRICKEGEEVEDGAPAVWDNGYGEWLYNWLGVQWKNASTSVNECQPMRNGQNLLRMESKIFQISYMQGILFRWLM